MRLPLTFWASDDVDAVPATSSVTITGSHSAAENDTSGNHFD